VKIAIIPARGGSKRIKRKNIKSFFDKPMIAWSIEAALNSETFDQVIVSTDDKEIADISREYGADIPFMRPADISDDFTVTSTVIKHALESINYKKENIEAVCCIYATAPFLTTRDINNGFSQLMSGNWDYAFSASEYSSTIFRAFQILEDNGIEMFDPDNYLKRSQDLPKAYHDAAQFYWAPPLSWVEEKPIFSPRSTPVVIPQWRVQDIDTQDDWINAELLAPFIYKKIQEN